MSKEEKYNRYQRQVILNEFGTVSQDKLFSVKVLVIGAGGLGCPALQYLAAAGVGQIGIVDFDIISLTNLQRQVLYATEEVGRGKAETAAKKIRALNPEIKVEVFNTRIQNSNALELISPYDIVLDGSDNFATRYLLNDACVLLNKPLIYGAVFQFEGQVGVFNLEDKLTQIKANYRDLFPFPPLEKLSCNEIGVIGVLPGIIGVMQAAETIKIVTDVGMPSTNKIISYNVLNNRLYEVEIVPNENMGSVMPKSKAELLKFDYEWFCNAPPINEQITPEDFHELLKNEKITVIDVREKDELPLITWIENIHLPMSEFGRGIKTISPTGKIVLICQSGKRSLEALQILKSKNPGCEVFSLIGGLDSWEKKSKSSV